jgi:hypothetical protein
VAQDDGNLKVIISRIQQRRGLKQDLPQPLRPGEIGFATDSQQVYIGADTENNKASTENKTVYLENTLGASTRTLSLANSQIIKFTVPHNRWSKGSGSFDGVSKSKSWLPDSNISLVSGITDGDGNLISRTVFDENVSSNDFINHNQTGRAFNADDVTVLIDGVQQSGDRSGTSVVVNTSFDYNFISGNLSTSDHQLYFRSAPDNSQDVAITYYSNSHVFHALSNTIIASGAAITGFHANAAIPEYREITSDLIYINPEVGTGYIGLEGKHIDIVAEGTGIENITSLTLANIVIAKDPVDPALYDGNVYSGIGNVVATVTQDVANIGSATNTVDFTTQFENIEFTELQSASSGRNGYVYLEGDAGSIVAGGAGGYAQRLYYHQRLLPINANTSGQSFSVDLPSNVFFTAKTSTYANLIPVSDTIVVVGANTSGVLTGDYVYINSSDSAVVQGNIFQVSTITGGNIVMVAETAGLLSSEAQSNITASFINYGTSNTGAQVQLFTPEHNLPVATTNIALSQSIGGISSGTEIQASNPNSGVHTFYIDTSAPVTSNITGVWQPVLGNILESDGLTVSPGYVLDLSGAGASTTLNTAIATIEEKQIWLNASLKPDTNDEIYLTSDDRRQYLLFNDPQDVINTWDELGITTQRYTRASHSIKAKLEDWLHRFLQDSKVNVISGVYSNQLYTSNTIVASSFNSWDISLDVSTDEILFDSNDEAGNFATLINRLYFKTNDQDKRGLINLKTNIELLTTSALESGQAETVYAQPLQVSIGSNTNVLLTDLGTDTASYDTLFIDYSIVGEAADSGNSSITRYYNRVGSLAYNGNPSTGGDSNGNVTGSVILHDVASESFDDYFTGNLTFSANIADGVVSIAANNSIVPTTSDIIMKYTVRKWKSQ